jgi:hypothetical protein
MNRRLLDIALKMSLHLLTLLEQDTAEYFIAEQQREIIETIQDSMMKEGD